MTAKIEVEVQNDAYTGTYSGESIEVREVLGEDVVFVHESDGTYTSHRSKFVESIELAE